MLTRCLGLLMLTAVVGCSNKQQITLPTQTFPAPSGTLRMMEIPAPPIPDAGGKNK